MSHLTNECWHLLAYLFIFISATEVGIDNSFNDEHSAYAKCPITETDEYLINVIFINDVQPSNANDRISVTEEGVVNSFNDELLLNA